MKKKPFIPFRMMPASWGLSGPAYDEAEAAYTLDGEDLARRLVEIRYGNDTVERNRRLLALDLQFGRVTPYQHDSQLLEVEGKGDDVRARLELEFKHTRIDEFSFAEGMINLEKDGTEREIALLDLKLRFGKVSEREHEKAVATLREEPWVGIVGDEFDINEGVNGFAIELDWNEAWITYLKLNGYVGSSDSDIVDRWFSDVCRVHGPEPTMPTEFEEAPPRRLINRIDRGGGRADYE